MYIVVIIITGDLNNKLLPVALVVAMIVSIVGVLVIGLPTHFVLTRIGQAKGAYYALVGFFVPALVTIVTHPFGEDGVSAITIQALVFGGFGAAVALIFWKVVTYDSST